MSKASMSLFSWRKPANSSMSRSADWTAAAELALLVSVGSVEIFFASGVEFTAVRFGLSGSFWKF
jgi:hypothetical protein